MLRTQLVLKNIVSTEDWEVLCDHIQFNYLYDNHFAELKKNELMNDKLAVVASMEPYLGRYFSAEYVRRQILGQSDTEMKEIDAQIKKEIEKGIIQDPFAQPMMQTGNQDTLGDMPQEPGMTDSQSGMNIGATGEI